MHFRWLFIQVSASFFLPLIIHFKHAHAECIETLGPINNAIDSSFSATLEGAFVKCLTTVVRAPLAVPAFVGPNPTIQCGRCPRHFRPHTHQGRDLPVPAFCSF